MRPALLSLIAAISFSVPAIAMSASKDAPEDKPQVKTSHADAGPGYELVQKDLARMPVEGDYVLGNAKAPVTLLEYASLSCPHCAEFHKETLPALQPYIDAGQLRYILRPFPLNEPALKGALLLDCVGEAGGADKYYTFAKVLFGAQSKWAFDANYTNALKTFAKVGGVNEGAFNSCVTDTDRELKLLNIRKTANDTLGVNRTPYFFIDGYRYTGNTGAKAVKAFVEDRLKAPSITQ